MKKGLLTVLLASLVLVGCQNYDDQFDDLNAQISALKSQVDGLSSLSGQVSSLSGTISGLSAGVAAAQAAASSANTAASAIDLTGLSASLATLQAEVDAVQASLATASTAAAVTALETQVAAIQVSVQELLDSSNVYSTNLSITSATELNTADALGNQLNIINGNVDIQPTAAMDMAKLQTVIDKIFTVNGTWNYTAVASSATQPTFTKLLSTGAMTITPSGDVRMDNLATAGNISITTTYESKIGILHMGSLTTSGTIGTGSAGTISLAQATEVHLTSLPYYGGSATQSLSITTKKGATLLLSALDDVTSAGAAANLSLTLNGPASFTSTNLKSYSGELDFTNVATVNVSGYSGKIDVNAGVDSLTVTGGVDVEIDGASDLVTANLNIINDDDPTLSTTVVASNANMSTNGQDLAFDSSDLTTVTISGKLDDVTFDGDASGVNLTNVDSITITATMDDLLIDDVDDLTSLTVTGASMHDITITDNDKLGSLNLDHSYNAAYDGATANTSSSFTATGNQELTTLTYKGSAVKTLQVTGNAKLATVDFSGMTTVGAAANVDIWNNNLKASKADDSSDGTLASADKTVAATATNDTGDLGSYTTTSGMGTLKTYLTAVNAQAAANANVYFDEVSLYVVSETGTEVQQNSGNAYTYASSTTQDVTAVLIKTPAVAGAASKVALKAKRGFVIDFLDGGATMQFTVNGVALFDTTANGTGTNLASNGNKDLDIAAIESSVNLTRAAAANVAIDAKRGANSSQTVSLVQYGGVAANDGSAVLGQKYTTATAAGGAATTTNYGFGVDDTVTLTVGANSVTISPGSGGATTLSGIADDVVAAWAAKYGSAGTASESALATVTNTAGILTVTMLQIDSAGYGVNVDFSAAGGTVTATSAANIDYVIGSSKLESDDATVDADIIFTVESLVAGVDENTISTLVTTTSDAASTNIVELATSYTTNSTFDSSTYASTQVERTDVRTAEDSVGAGTGTAALIYSRVHWLG